MDKKTKALRVLPSKSELVDNATDLVASFTTSLPGAIHSTETLLSVALGGYAGKRIVKWGQDLFSKVKNIKKGEKLVKPIDKFVETLKFLDDRKITDEELLEALKNLHALTLSADTNDSDEIEVYALIERLRELKGIEIAIILACYNIYARKYPEDKMTKVLESYANPITQSGPWCIVVSRALGFSNSDYISVQQNHLEELELITPRSMNTQWTGKASADFVPRGKFRLTDSGYRLAEFIEKGRELPE